MKFNTYEYAELVDMITEAAHQTMRAAPSDEDRWQSPGEEWFEMFLESLKLQVTDDEA